MTGRDIFAINKIYPKEYINIGCLPGYFIKKNDEPLINKLQFEIIVAKGERNQTLLKMNKNKILFDGHYITKDELKSIVFTGPQLTLFRDQQNYIQMFDAPADDQITMKEYIKFIEQFIYSFPGYLRDMQPRIIVAIKTDSKDIYRAHRIKYIYQD